MATPAQQSSPATTLPMSVKELTSLPSLMSYPPLFIASWNNIIIGGDMNAQIGKNVNKFSLHNSSNRNGVLTSYLALRDEQLSPPGGRGSCEEKEKGG